MTALCVEVTRGDLVECRHTVHVAIVSPQGTEVWGDGQRPTFPRSAAKLLFALPLLESGAAKAQGLSPTELALACSSHGGENFHVAAVRAWLARQGLTEEHLACGPSWPMHEPACRHHDSPLAITNCCSGKHTGFLTLAQHQGWDLDGYNEADHPVQQALKTTLESVLEAPAGPIGIDGCNIPTYANTLEELARGYFNLTQATGVRGEAALTLFQAHKSDAAMIGGTDRLCTEANQALSAPGMVKFGADGVYVGACHRQKVAFALKAEDGSMRGAEPVLVWVLRKLGMVEPQALQRHLPAAIRSRDGRQVGEVRISADAAH